MSSARAKLQKTILTVDLGQIARNYNALKAFSGLADMAAVVKADAYGLGAKHVSQALYEAGCREFFVAQLEEGVELTECLNDDVRIYVLNGPAISEVRFFTEHNLIPVLNSYEQCEEWARWGKGLPCALHFDTGMNRLGLRENETDRLLRKTDLLSTLNIIHVMSHLACAPDEAHELNAKQLSRFKKIAKFFPDAKKSLANSAGIYLGKHYHLDTARPGCALYGLMATDNLEQEVQKPVAALSAPIIQIADVKARESLGYNASYVAPRDMTVATLPIGYADGFPILSTPAPLAKHGSQNFDIIGRVSMDLTLVDITDARSKLHIGSMMSLLNKQTEATAKAAGCLNYELLTRLGSRFEKRYFQ